MRAKSCRRRPSLGFNPCFSGFTSTTSVFDWMEPACLSFQSLFFWIHFYNPAAASCSPSPSKFQSLFFWIHFYNSSSSRPSSTKRRSFNPCFSGFTSTTLAAVDEIAVHSAFQSLFFWIHFYNLASAESSRPCAEGFNPCFSGFTSTTEDVMQHVVDFLGFQSLFFWIHFYNAGGASARRRGFDVSILVFLDSLLQLP